MNNPLHEEIIASLAEQYNRPLIRNVHRGGYVESMIALALGAEWHLVALEWDWAPWDIQHDDGTRIEVKQSAALQPWSTFLDAPRPSPASFDIAERKERWTKGGNYPVYEAGRPADIYIFAWHSEKNLAIADHRSAEQWQFFVVLKRKLTALHGSQKKIGLNPIRRLASPVTYDQLAAEVAEAAERVWYLRARGLW